ncbi:MAG: hypothetical protein M1818_002939 [Claussenomyces sp. TS43310]|nr:MAG: hypothetical protein M1818_002939 [Claussenomyces sp. TS43310]
MTDASFNPEREAFHSTGQWNFNYNPQQYDFKFEKNYSQNLSQRLPHIRDTAKKYARWNGDRRESFVVNTSALGRAFPDFSQGGSSEDDLSVEIGRGPKTRQRTSSRVPQLEYSDILESPVIKIGDLDVRSTPPIKSKAKPVNKQHRLSRNSEELDMLSTTAVRKQAKSSTKQQGNTPNSIVNGSEKGLPMQKENVAPGNAPLSSKKNPDYVSGATRTSSGDQRRTLAELHAQVADDSQCSLVNDERPPTVTFATRNSRFSSNPNHDSLRTNKPALQQRAGQSSTQQSFLVPDMPDISELVSSSIRKSNTGFTASDKIKYRLSSHGILPSRDELADVDIIPIPEEEKAIYVSLELLQDKVAALEMEKVDIQNIVEDLRSRNYQLEAQRRELERYHRSDSALGDSGSDKDYYSSNKKLTADVASLEHIIMSLNKRVEASDRTIASQEERLEKSTVERDQAVKQLTAAQDKEKQLSAENKILRQENSMLLQELGKFSTSQNEYMRQLQQKESLLRSDDLRHENAMLLERLEKLVLSNEDSARQWQEKELCYEEKLQRRDYAFREMRELTKELKLQSSTSSAATAQNPDFLSTYRSKRRSGQRRSEQSTRPTPAPQSEKLEVPVVDATEETRQTIHKDMNLNLRDEDTNHMSDYSSILGHGEMQSVRQLLAKVKAQNQEPRAAARDENLQNDTARSVRSVPSVYSVASLPGNPLTLRNSPKTGLTGILRNSGTHELGDTIGHLTVESGSGAGKNQTARSDIPHRRRHSDNSINTIDAEEMTSAFIIPDITLHGAISRAEHPILSESAKCVLNKLAQHDGNNCTVCSRIAAFESMGNTTTRIDTKQITRIDKPVPVSERMPTALPHEDEPTMRPMVAPGLALATVMKGLQDELAHLKLQLALHQTVYNRHDPSLSMRKRKAVKAKVDRLLKAVDMKADQIYALYDVLEGQKQSGQVLTEEEVEVTLQSIGVTFETEKTAEKASEEDDRNSDLELPWEGIEETDHF